MRFFIFLLVLVPMSLLSQTKKEYFQIGPAINLKKSSSLIGGSIGVGFIDGVTGIGLGMDVYGYDKSVLVPVYVDLRYYFSSSKNKTYFLLQPGYAIRSKTIPLGGSKIVESGGVFAASGLGLITHLTKFSINFQVRYSIISTKATYQTSDDRYISSTKSSPGYFGLSLLFMPGDYN
jgi:hypothetical protein